MYGLPADHSTLSFLIGKEITQIAIGVYDTQVHWGTGAISIWSKFRLSLSDGREIDWMEGQPRQATELVALLGARISELGDNSEHLDITFSNGCVLALSDPNPQFESFSISERGRSLIVV